MIWLLLLFPSALYASFIVGLGMADVTGPACDVNFMGYANPKQVSAGIHLRQWARAFVVAEEKHPERRIAYVSVDFGMGSQAVTREVLRQLEVRYPKQYSLGNLFISGTHTHSGPGGYDQYAIDQLASGGFVPETLHAYSKGIVNAIVKAHDSAQPKRRIRFGTGQAEPHSNINRSPTAYMENPASERAMYDGNTEQYFSLLRFDSSANVGLGMFNWYAVHATSLPNTNLLISGDNKGYASQLFEQWFNPPGTLPGRGEFVAGFASTNLGDVSPNVNGTFCKFSGKPCDEAHSTCFGFSEFCLGRGPGKTEMDSTRIIGERQARAAKTAFESKNLLKEVQGGSIVSRHRVVDFSDVTIESHVAVQLEQVQGGSRSLFAASTAKTCKSALGYSFAAGTTDGPGAFDFYQGETRGNRFWETIRNFIKVPSNESMQCHHPKPILLPTGEIDFPYAWEPRIMSIGFGLVGKSVAILTVPAEFSTMAGRRLKRIVKNKLVDQGLLETNGVVLLSCLTNAYAHYVVTFEEYQVQRYEGASTLFGPHTLAAYIQEFIKLIDEDKNQLGDNDIPNLVPHAITVLPKPGSDKIPRGKRFGGIVLDAKPKYTRHDDLLVAVEFYSANLRHDYRHEDSFLTVELLHGETGKWAVVHTDSSFDTRLMYSRSGRLGGLSVVRVEWHIDFANTLPGTYRISHSAAYLSAARNATLQPFTGYSQPFHIE
ncbi:hypothetical protein BASA81_012111 [Batrachochytrium salamandrivorans]|nr:hypothetical protein BASA81_012111 [Batrachochytrium salamandrivorans]